MDDRGNIHAPGHLYRPGERAFLICLPKLGRQHNLKDTHPTANRIGSSPRPCYNPGMSDHIAAIDSLLETIQHFRARPEMYLDSVEPRAFVNFLNGMHTGLQAIGLRWSVDHRFAAVERRGLECSSTKWETEALEGRGLSPAQVVDELLAIEYEMWQAHRAELTRDAK